MSTVDQLIASQVTVFNDLKKICADYRKDGSVKKNLQYLEKRSSVLYSTWELFERNHQLIEQTGVVDIPYFREQVYTKAKNIYDNVIGDMQARKSALIAASLGSGEEESEFTFEDALFDAPAPEARDNKERTRELLRQQSCNFKAFARVIAKVSFSTSTEKWELEDNLNVMKSKWGQIEKLHWHLDYILTDDGTEGKEYREKYTRMENVYDDLRKKINHKIWNNAHYEKATPKIVIPDFYGNYNQWTTFKDLYTESVHNNPLLSNAQKMQHLKTKLKGEAEKLVQHLGISADNYTSCWEIITHRYDNKRLLFTSYINTLLNQPTIQQANAVGIRKLHDVMQECLNGLGNIGIDITTWDPIIVHLLVQKLDSGTYNEYMKDLNDPRDLPDLEEFTKFLESKFMALEALQGGTNHRTSNFASNSNKHQTFHQTSNKPHNNNQSLRKHYNNYNVSRSTYYKPQNSPKAFFTTTRTCPLCKSEHPLMQCPKFLDMSAAARRDTVRNLQVCTNCLYSHAGKQCLSRKKCKLCHKSHHTLMHGTETEQQNNNGGVQQPAIMVPPHVNNLTSGEKEVLLTTVQLKAKTIDGDYINLRALLDQGSQVSLITEDAAQRLRLPRRKVSAVVSGVGSLSGNCKGSINLECKSIHSDYTFKTETLVMNKLINNLPSTSFSIENWHYLTNLKLADPYFNVSGPVDLLLGADIYSEMILSGVMKSEDNNHPVAQQTRVGWILSGNVKTFNCLVTLNELENMSRFWETEEIPENTTSTSDNDYCEKYYTETTMRLPEGNYVVKMPMKPDYKANLGSTKPQAQAQFLQLEQKMRKNKEFETEYKRFMNEYITMGHMKPVTSETKAKGQVYLPHHGVLRAESTTTKLRVVFNASYKTKNEHSLNDLMYTGPNLQKDMLTLLINWRLHKYVFTADVEKMYRYIGLNENQQNLQTIYWRDSPQHPLQEWQLCTVTYGTKAAPYLAMRTLHQLARDEEVNYPVAARVLRHFFYMDDLAYGHDDIEESKKLVKELIELLKKGGFNLRKWTSNDPRILDDLTDEQKSNKNTINFKQENQDQSTTKMLGISWNPAQDSFSFRCKLNERNKHTKRTVLADISKLYDPLGWLAPIIIKAKILFQRVWASKIDWDETLPSEMLKEWEKLREDLTNINNIKLPRWLRCIDNKIEIHGFCDASEKAYACAIYSRVLHENDEYVITLIAAKTKVAPLSKKVTLPRLELCGALLLAKLLEKLKSTLEQKEVKVHCWCDSKVTLAWISGNVNKWERYIANRVTQIRNIVPASDWSYVKSDENAADCATRGLLPSQLLPFQLWWEGPQWLKTNYRRNNQQNETFTTKEDSKTNCYVMKNDTTEGEIINSLLNKYSQQRRVTRVVAWILRAIALLRNKQKRTDLEVKGVTNLTLQEVTRASELIYKTIQRRHFTEEIERLNKNSNIPKKSNLTKLTPFIDDKGLLRVRGRLINSMMPTEAKHPIIIPATGRLTELLIQEAHQETLHGGARLCLAYLRQRFWIIGGNKTVKKQLRQCVRCHRYKPHRNQQLMADLPKVRVTQAKVFSSTGVDFTGCVDIKINKGRGVKTCKAYIAIFICMVTKAIHLELVSDLSTQTFLAAFKRMCARRGTPKNMYSDNGTNFVGAAKVLQEEFLRNKTFETSEFFDEMTHMSVKWHFNAPLWPSAGGLWEAGVKAMKYHLKRVLGEQKLTFEQFTTLLAQIEACLNSRPLCPLSEDIEDLEYLTPGHFLIGGPLLSLPQEEEDINQYDLRNRWRLIEQMNIHFWKRWSNEYLHEMQIRSKWQRPEKNLEKGDVVLVKEENLPAGKWALGKVTEVHPGSDGHVRVVSIKTKKGNIKRPISKLAPLPKQEEEPVHPIQSYNKNKSTIKGSLFTLLTIMLLMIGTVSSAPTSNYKVTPIENNKPIYFDEIGQLQLIHDEWTLLIYYNLTTYWQATDKLHTYIDHIDRICQRMSYVPCDALCKQLRHELRQLNEYNSLLLSQHLQRQKRGYFDGIGKLARTLFGVLDEEFADKYENDIKILQTNEDYLLQLMKNQTVITEAENNIIKRSDEFMNSQFEVMHAYMNMTSKEIEKIENKVQMLFTVNDVHSASITATLIINNLQRIQRMLLDALSDIYKGHLDVYLFSASQLINQLTIIKGKLPRGLSLPVKDIQEDIQEIYKHLYVKARITDNYLLFEIHIPLINEEEYTIYRVIPIPFKRQGQLKVVQPSSNKIAINFIQKSYIIINDKDEHHCTTYSKDKFICMARQPVYNLHDKNAPCEVNVFSQQTPLSCVINDIECKDTWTQLHKPYWWLFTFCDKNIMNIICADQVTPIVIDGTGVIALKPQCILQKNDATIYTYSHLGSRVTLDSDIEVPTVNNSINNIFDLNWKNKEINITEKKTFTSKDFMRIQEQLTYQKEKEQLPGTTGLNVHDIYHYSITSLLLGSALVVALVIWLKKKCKKETKIPTTSDNKEKQTVEIEVKEISRPRPVREHTYSTPSKTVPRSRDREFAFYD